MISIERSFKNGIFKFGLHLSSHICINIGICDFKRIYFLCSVLKYESLSLTKQNYVHRISSPFLFALYRFMHHFSPLSLKNVIFWWTVVWWQFIMLSQQQQNQICKRKRVCSCKFYSKSNEKMTKKSHMKSQRTCQICDRFIFFI